MIIAIEKNLRRGIKLLNQISDIQYSDTSVGPYNASVGIHIRHILDVFNCFFEGLSKSHVDLTVRNRNKVVEVSTAAGLKYFDVIISKLKLLEEDKLGEKILVTDDLGGKITSQEYTIGALLMQTNSHTIHHFASLGYIINQLEIELPDNDFGFNPTTPRTRAN